MPHRPKKSKEEAYKAVFEDASSFSEYSLDDTNQPKILLAYLNDNGFTAQTIDEIMVAEDASGETLGYAFTVTDSEVTVETSSLQWVFKMTEP